MAPRSDPKDKAENFFNDDADVTDAADPEQNAEPAVEEEEELSVEDLAGAPRTASWPSRVEQCV